MQRGGILALDLAHRVGWALGHPGQDKPLNGVWVLPEGDLGRALASFENELEDTIALHGPVLVLAEAPLHPNGASNPHSWRQQMGLAAMAESTCYRHDIHYREQAASTIRAAVLGTCRFPKGEAKTAVLEYCAGRGWRVPDHNAADACVCWEWACRNSGRLYRRVAA